MNRLIGGAWPYANGSLHIGQIAALLPADVLARYFRLVGDQVCYVSGTDAFGTPVAIRAKKEGKSPREISDAYHKEFVESFNYLGFSYDYYGITSSEVHQEFVRDFHRKLYESPYISEKTSPQTFCSTCNKFLVDRLVVGICPSCGLPARGDQCDSCGSVYQPEELVERTCSVCDSEPKLVQSTHLELALIQMKDQLEQLVNQNNWRQNAQNFTRRYIEEGLRNRAITRDLDWGIRVPKPGYEDKCIYIWAENVLGYLSSCYVYFEGDIERFEEFWNGPGKHYYVHGKDNIPFHSIILPGLLIAHGAHYHLPDEIVSSEYLTLEGKKISTSNNHGIWVKDLIGHYQPDAFRYFLIANGPEKRDTDFSWHEFNKSINGELLGAYGNFINRNLAFITKSFASKVPKSIVDIGIKEGLNELYQSIGEKIEKQQFKEALNQIFDYIRSANKYFDQEKPWATLNEDEEKCRHTLFNCIQIIANLAILLEPFLPFSSQKVIDWLGLERVWQYQEVTVGHQIPPTEILFERLS